VKRKPTLTDRLEYAAFASVIGAAARLSRRRAELLGERLGRFGYRRLKIRRHVVEQQLELAFPERDSAWHAATAQAAYEHIGREMMMAIRMSAMSRDDAARIVDHRIGRDRFYDAVRAGQGVVLVAGHLGNWEIGAASIAAQGYPIAAIYQPQRNPLFNARVVEARTKLGLELIPRAKATRSALEKLRAGHIVCFVSDQNAGRSGVFVPFFGRLAATHRGAALLAARTGAPLFLGVAVREGQGYLGITEEITVTRAGELDAVVHDLTAAYTMCLETLVRRWPEQYFWHHRRWKTRPNEEG
jgi:Kdo2-lipid IVA lauroyltransferase/acyltransferase